MSHCHKTSSKNSSFFSQCFTSCPKSSRTSFIGRPYKTPFAFATAIPSAYLFLIFSHSFCATKERICSTKSAINVPIKFLPHRRELKQIFSFMPVPVFLSIFWLVLHMHLGFPVFPIRHGENISPNQRHFCRRFSIECCLVFSGIRNMICQQV